MQKYIITIEDMEITAESDELAMYKAKQRMKDGNYQLWIADIEEGGE